MDSSMMIPEEYNLNSEMCSVFEQLHQQANESSFAAPAPPQNSSSSSQKRKQKTIAVVSTGIEAAVEPSQPTKRNKISKKSKKKTWSISERREEQNTLALAISQKDRVLRGGSNNHLSISDSLRAFLMREIRQTVPVVKELLPEHKFLLFGEIPLDMDYFVNRMKIRKIDSESNSIVERFRPIMRSINYPDRIEFDLKCSHSGLSDFQYIIEALRSMNSPIAQRFARNLQQYQNHVKQIIELNKNYMLQAGTGTTNHPNHANQYQNPQVRFEQSMRNAERILATLNPEQEVFIYNIISKEVDGIVTVKKGYSKGLVRSLGVEEEEFIQAVRNNKVYHSVVEDVNQMSIVFAEMKMQESPYIRLREHEVRKSIHPDISDHLSHQFQIILRNLVKEAITKQDVLSEFLTEKAIQVSQQQQQQHCHHYLNLQPLPSPARPQQTAAPINNNTATSNISSPSSIMPHANSLMDFTSFHVPNPLPTFGQYQKFIKNINLHPQKFKFPPHKQIELFHSITQVLTKKNNTINSLFPYQSIASLELEAHQRPSISLQQSLELTEQQVSDHLNQNSQAASPSFQKPTPLFFNNHQHDQQHHLSSNNLITLDDPRYNSVYDYVSAEPQSNSNISLHFPEQYSQIQSNVFLNEEPFRLFNSTQQVEDLRQSSYSQLQQPLVQQQSAQSSVQQSPLHSSAQSPHLEAIQSQNAPAKKENKIKDFYEQLLQYIGNDEEDDEGLFPFPHINSTFKQDIIKEYEQIRSLLEDNVYLPSDQFQDMINDIRSQPRIKKKQYLKHLMKIPDFEDYGKKEQRKREERIKRQISATDEVSNNNHNQQKDTTTNEQKATSNTDQSNNQHKRQSQVIKKVYELSDEKREHSWQPGDFLEVFYIGKTKLWKNFSKDFILNNSFGVGTTAAIRHVQDLQGNELLNKFYPDILQKGVDSVVQDHLSIGIQQEEEQSQQQVIESDGQQQQQLQQQQLQVFQQQKKQTVDRDLLERIIKQFKMGPPHPFKVLLTLKKSLQKICQHLLPGQISQPFLKNALKMIVFFLQGDTDNYIKCRQRIPPDALDQLDKKVMKKISQVPII